MLTLQERVELFRSNTFFQDAPDEVLAGAARIARECDFERGAFVYAKNDTPEDFYLLIEGRIGHPEVQAAEAQYSVAREVSRRGQFFGFAAVVQGMPRRVISAR